MTELRRRSERRLGIGLAEAEQPACRRCVDCEGSPHHWFEDPRPHSVTDWVCKHCEARGTYCPGCAGEEEKEHCEICGGDGVVEVVARRLLAAPSVDAGGWIIGNAERTQWRCWGDAGPEWTSDREAALRFARRTDAEAVATEDEGAWRIERYPPDAALPFAAPTLRTGDELREARDKDAVANG